MAALPADVCRQARSGYRQFMENPRHPGCTSSRFMDRTGWLRSASVAITVRWGCGNRRMRSFGSGSAPMRNMKGFSQDDKRSSAHLQVSGSRFVPTGRAENAPAQKNPQTAKAAVCAALLCALVVKGLWSAILLPLSGGRGRTNARAREACPGTPPRPAASVPRPRCADAC